MQKQGRVATTVTVLILLIGLAGVFIGHKNKVYAQVGYGNTAQLTITPTTATQTPTTQEQPAAEEPQQTCKTIELDQKTTFQNGAGYQISVNDCSVLKFSTTESKEKIKYAIIVDQITNHGVDLNVAAANDATHPIARFTLAYGKDKTFETSPLATTALYAKLISIKNNNQAILRFARVAKKGPFNSAPKALPVLVFLGLSAITILLYIIFKPR